MEFHFERAAMQGAPPPKNLSGAELAMFWGLTYLYKLYYQGSLSREAAAKEKEGLAYKLDLCTRKIEAERKLSEHTVNLWKTIDLVHGRFVREQSIEAAQALSAAIYGKLRVIPRPVGDKPVCPVCDAPFSAYQIENKPRYCEHCGFPIKWEGGD